MVQVLVGMGEVMGRLAVGIECGGNVGGRGRCRRVYGGYVEAGAVSEVAMVRRVQGSWCVRSGAGEAVVFQQSGDGEEV